MQIKHSHRMMLDNLFLLFLNEHNNKLSEYGWNKLNLCSGMLIDQAVHYNDLPGIIILLEKGWCIEVIDYLYIQLQMDDEKSIYTKDQLWYVENAMEKWLKKHMLTKNELSLVNKILQMKKNNGN